MIGHQVSGLLLNFALLFALTYLAAGLLIVFMSVAQLVQLSPYHLILSW